MTVWLLLSANAGTPSAEEIRTDWAALKHPEWVYRPEFSDQEWKRLAEGQVVKRRERVDGADRVLGAMWSPAAKDPLWVAIQDESHWVVVDGYVDEDLPGSTFADRVLYQRIGLPWPFADRQWVIAVGSNRALLATSGGRIWERTWTLSPRRGATVEAADAVWVGENEGGWILADAGVGTLVVYHVRATVDGNIPDEAATQWAQMTVAGLLEDVDDRAREAIPSHYIRGHAPIERPDGSNVPLYPPPAP